MVVPHHSQQHAVMREAVQNMFPDVRARSRSAWLPGWGMAGEPASPRLPSAPAAAARAAEGRLLRPRPPPDASPSSDVSPSPTLAATSTRAGHAHRRDRVGPGGGGLQVHRAPRRGPGEARARVARGAGVAWRRLLGVRQRVPAGVVCLQAGSRNARPPACSPARHALPARSLPSPPPLRRWAPRTGAACRRCCATPT